MGCHAYSYLGMTNVLRKRMNSHISESKNGITMNVFDKHVYECKENHAEPLFKCHVLMQLNDYDKLRVYEDNFHKQGFDVANKGKASITSNSNGR